MKNLIFLITIVLTMTALSTSCISYSDSISTNTNGTVEVVPGITARTFVYDDVEYIAFSGSNGLAVLPKDCGQQTGKTHCQGMPEAALYGKPLSQTLYPPLKPLEKLYIPKPLNLPEP